MSERKLLPWRKMWDFVAACGEGPDLQTMIRHAVVGLPRLVPCEHFMVCMAAVDVTCGSLAITAEHNGLPERVIKSYCEYYFHKDTARLSLDPSSPTYQIDWRDVKFKDNEFARDFIHRLLQSELTAGIPIWDADGLGGINFIFSRVGNGAVSSREEAILRSLRPHLSNLYSLFKRIERLPADHLFAAELARESQFLSKREAEIAGLLCKRLHAHEIATRLLISKRTVETHIQHIYNKLHVNNRVELLHRLIG